MSPYRVVALDERIADEVRRTRRTPGYGHPAHVEVASGTGPCRLCLRPFEVGVEEGVLFTYNPFPDGATPSPGPIFVHAGPCPRSETDRFPSELSGLPLLLEGYDDGGMALVPSAGGGGSRADVRGVLAVAGVSYAHIRHAEAGCFIARIERG
jgi:uncharacterized protein DUF1203